MDPGYPSGASLFGERDAYCQAHNDVRVVPDKLSKELIFRTQQLLDQRRFAGWILDGTAAILTLF